MRWILRAVAGAAATRLCPETSYHGASIEAALAIQDHGFDVAFCNAMATLGPGVYFTTTLKKAMHYVEGKEAGGIIFELRIDVGHCKMMTMGDPMRTTWQQHGWDSCHRARLRAAWGKTVSRIPIGSQLSVSFLWTWAS